MKKTIYFNVIMVLMALIISPGIQAQSSKSKGMEKTLQGTEKLNENTRQMNENMSEINNQVQQSNANVIATVESAKAIIKVFEPILRLHLRKKNTTGGISDQPRENAASEPGQETGEVEAGQETGAEQPNQESNAQGDVPAEQISYEDLANSTELFSESPAYNTDGTANLGNQNHKEFGCYIDITRGFIMDDVDAADKTASVDLIFTATDYFGSAPMYALLTPAYVKNDFFSNYYFRGPNYKDANIPMKQ